MQGRVGIPGEKGPRGKRVSNHSVFYHDVIYFTILSHFIRVLKDQKAPKVLLEFLATEERWVTMADQDLMENQDQRLT